MVLKGNAISCDGDLNLVGQEAILSRMTNS